MQNWGVIGRLTVEGLGGDWKVGKVIKRLGVDCEDGKMIVKLGY